MEPMKIGSFTGGRQKINQTHNDEAGLASCDDDYWTTTRSFREDTDVGEIRREGPSMNRTTGIQISRTSNKASDDASLIDDWMENVRHKMRTAWQNRPSCNKAPCTIYEVPINIQKHDTQAYQPRVVAIGPFHRGKPGLCIANDHKWSCLKYLLSCISPTLSEDDLLRRWVEMIKSEEELARSCYSRDADMDSFSFVEMLLLDGCFILNILLMIAKKTEIVVEGPSVEETVVEDLSVEEISKANKKIMEVKRKKDDEENPLFSMFWLLNLVKLDLLLLENQIPFFIVQDLFDLIEDPGIRHNSVALLALELFDELHPKINRDFLRHHLDFGFYGNGIHHLLHLFHSALQPSSNYKMTDTECWDPGSPSSSSTVHLHIPSATELGESAVQFRRKDDASSFLEVAFCGGELEIPTSYIFDYSNALFRNLIAFEQCYPGVRPYITAYASFMECIMHSERDVRLLHLSGTIVNKLSTDKDVAIFFKQICYQVNHTSIPNYLSPLYKKVADHHKHQWRRWNAELKRQYFSNPWLIMSLLAGTSLLCLNFIQTLYTVLGYYQK